MKLENQVDDFSGAFCSQYRDAVELIGRRWTGVIVRAMLHGIVRFSDLRDNIPALSDRMLSERLKELEAESLLTRTVIPEMPVRVEYRLTPKGQALGTVIEAITVWAYDWLTPPLTANQQEILVTLEG